MQRRPQPSNYAACICYERRDSDCDFDVSCLSSPPHKSLTNLTNKVTLELRSLISNLRSDFIPEAVWRLVNDVVSSLS